MSNIFGKMVQILIVEGDPDIGDLLEYLLSSQNYEVMLCANARIFKEEIEKSRRLDLILMDIMLPDGDGQILCQELGEKEGTKEIPVVLMSAHVEGMSLKNCRAKAFLKKPFHIEHLFRTVRKYIN